MSEEGISRLTKKDEEQIAQLFQELDRDNDGKIDIEDLIARLKSKNVGDASKHAQVTEP